MYALFFEWQKKTDNFLFYPCFFLCHTDVMLSGFGGGIENMEVNLCVSQGRMSLRFLLFFAGFVEISAGLAKISERLVTFLITDRRCVRMKNHKFFVSFPFSFMYFCTL